MPNLHRRAVRLDYGPGADGPMVRNVSGIAAEGGRLWTVSDEGRSVERLRKGNEGYVLDRHLSLDRLIPGLPGNPGDEIDLESLDIAEGRLWLCGSHTRVRKEREPGDTAPRKGLRDRPSRALFASLALHPEDTPGDPQHLPATGTGSLRDALNADDWLAPFAALPSKENGIDIEGMAIVGGAPVLGLRGPLIDGLAIAVWPDLDVRFRLRRHRLSFLDLGGLGIRDLTRWGDGLAVLAGPTGPARAPFALYNWTPAAPDQPEVTRLMFEWDRTEGKPEGICPRPDAENALIVVADGGLIDGDGVLLADVIDGLPT